LRFLCYGLLLCLFGQECIARAKNVEIWFLNSRKIKKSVEHPFKINLFQHVLLAQMAPNCIPVDGYCYDAALGIYVKPEQLTHTHPVVNEPNANDETEQASASFDGPIPTSKADQLQNANLIECDQNQFFDLFCGEAQKTKPLVNSGFEVWIDTSSSLYAIDPEGDTRNCARKTFIDELKHNCQDLKYFAFDTNKKAVTNTQDLCLNVGLNDTKKLISWIEESTAERLIIITDIGEYTTELSNYMTKIAGQLKGAEVEEPLTPAELVSHASLVAKFCSK
jgi:hypothetical protein